VRAPPEGAAVRRADAGPGKGQGQGQGQETGALDKVLRVFSLLTMAMTVPQVVSVWRGHAQGVSVLSWATYLVSACLWMVYGLRQRDRTIYLPCLGWIALDALIVVGVWWRG
jgi:uncharacterized protein with PQ loop repeat